MRRKLLVILAALLFIAPTAMAQGNRGQGLEISPPLLELKAKPGQTVTTKIKIRNVTQGTLIAKAQVNDFTSNNQDGLPQLQLDSNEKSPYSIIDWVQDIPDTRLEKGKQETVNVTLRVPGNASPGAHFGVVRFTGTSPELEDTGVSLSASLGSLVFISVAGDATESAQIEKITTSHNNKERGFFEKGPVTVTEVIKNTGNVYLKPSGTVRVTSMFGKEVKSFSLNEQNGIVLPGSSRNFSQTLDKSWMFGRYTIQVDTVYGEDNTIISKSHSFWVIPYKLILIVLLAIVGLVWGIRRYNKYIVKKARR